MSESIQDDEIDLFELFATLWAGKGLIVLSTAIFLLGGVVGTLSSTKVYELDAKILLPTCRLSGSLFVDWNCEDVVFGKVTKHLSDAWDQDLNQSIISFNFSYPKIHVVTAEPKTLQFYQNEFDDAFSKTIRDLSLEAERMQAIIEQRFADDIAPTEISVQLDLKSQLVSQWLQENSASIGSFVILSDDFESPIIRHKSRILTLSLVLGWVVGAAAVLLRKVMRDRATLT